MYIHYEERIPENSPYMIAADNRVEEVNALFLDLSGYEEKDILGRKVEEVWQQFLRISMDLGKIKNLHECDCYMFDLSRTVKEVSVQYYEQPVSKQGTYIFQQKKNSMFDEKYPFLNQVNSVNDTGIALFSIPDFVLLKANKGFYKYFSKRYESIEDILGLPLEVLLPSWRNSETYDKYLNVAKSGQPVFFNEHLLEFPEIGSFYARYTLTPILEEERVKYIVQIHNDVTGSVEKRHQTEDVMRMKDEFVYFISHEFKTPLTVINAAVQNLENIYASQIPDKAKILIDKIKQNTYRQLRLVKNLLDITRINSGKIKLKKRNIDVVFLTRAITESVAIFAQQKGIDIIFTSKLRQKVIGVDDEKFERILLNLLSNAIKFTPSGKKIEVELSSKLYKNRRMVCVKVKDQGIGIPQKKQSIIFERFEQVDSMLTRQAEGSGIGLYLVKLMVNAFGGDITLESEIGKGSVFTLMIPSKKVKKNIEEREIKHISDNRIIQSIATEFSDIYL